MARTSSDATQSESYKPYTSFSRLTAYTGCSKQYKLKYIKGPDVEESFNEHFAKGNLVHACLENYLNPETDLTIYDAIKLAVPEWLDKQGLSMDVDAVIEFGLGFAELMYSASDRYKEPEGAIRTKDGGVPKDIFKYPPTSFTQVLKASGLVTKRTALETEASRQQQHWEKISFGRLVASSLFMAYYFELPPWYKRTIGVEIPISTGQGNDVLFTTSPTGRELYFRAFMDWVVESQDDKVLILDHKTGKKKPTPQDVINHPQLNVYAYLYEQVYGRWPDIIGINHPWTGSIVLAKVDKEIAVNTMKYFVSVQRAIDQEHFLKHLPSEYNSPCIKREWKNNSIREVCPYLQHCWPAYYETIEHEILSLNQLEEIDD